MMGYNRPLGRLGLRSSRSLRKEQPIDLKQAMEMIQRQETNQASSKKKNINFCNESKLKPPNKTKLKDFFRLQKKQYSSMIVMLGEKPPTENLLNDVELIEL